MCAPSTVPGRRSARRRNSATVMGNFSARSAAALHVFDDLLLLPFGGPNEAQEISRMNVVGPEELPVATAAIHQLVRQFAVQPTFRLLDDAGQPDDAFELIRLRRQI